ncbi:MAG: transglycosylase SLT domain-containing protein [Deltaproteobacteria bacterium]|nr:transglycosylase SLT domain-containing protein [Deltaproteobacteria bacterium]
MKTGPRVKNPIRTILVAFCLLFPVIAWPLSGDADVSDPANLLRLVGNAMTGAPLDFCGEPVPLDNPEIRERLEREMLLALWNRPQVIFLLNQYGRYMPHIEKMLKDSAMPDDLKYMVIIESSLKHYAVSPKGATGFWQFMAPTGSRYGLTITQDRDERRNVFASTTAAIRYLKSLYGMLHSWTLAAAAFNMGEEGLKTEILIQKVSDYYKLYLPVETQRYVFRIISAKLILSKPEKYGFLPVKEQSQIPPDRIELTCSQRVPLQIVAEAAKTYFKVIKELNPEIRGYYLSQGSHTLLIPGGAAAGFQDRYETRLNKWLTESKECLYTVKKGDSLSSLAARFNVPLPALLVWNRLTSGKKPLVPGEKLVIYSNSAASQAKQEKEQ